MFERQIPIGMLENSGKNPCFEVASSAQFQNMMNGKWSTGMAKPTDREGSNDKDYRILCRSPKVVPNINLKRNGSLYIELLKQVE